MVGLAEKKVMSCGIPLCFLANEIFPTVISPISLAPPPMVTPRPAPTAGPSSQPVRCPIPELSSVPSATPPLPNITISVTGSPSNPVISATPSFPQQPVPSAAPLSMAAANVLEEDTRAAQWKTLTDKFDETRMQKHEWTYDTDFLPIYRYQTVTRISDIWNEWSTGLNGYLAVRNLNEAWNARWRRGDRGQGTENCRRNRVVELIEKLAAKPKWNITLALRFLAERYEGSFTPRKFCDYIQKNAGAGFQDVMNAALTYPS